MSRKSTSPKIPGLPFEAKRLRPAEAGDLLARGLAAETRFGYTMPEGLRVDGLAVDLPFGKSLRLAQLKLEDDRQAMAGALYVLEAGGNVYVLDGSSTPIYAANERAAVEIAASNAATYLRYFTFALRGQAGGFTLVEALAPNAPRGSEDAERIAQHAHSLTPKGCDVDGRQVLGGAVCYGGGLFEADFAIDSEGIVEMVDDRPLEDDVPEGFVEMPPTLHPASYFAARLGSSPGRALVELMLEQVRLKN